MAKLNVNKIGLTTGIFTVIISLICGLSVWIFGAGAVMSFLEIFTHTKIVGFQAITLTAGKIVLSVIASFIAGYVLGVLFAAIYNALKAK